MPAALTGPREAPASWRPLQGAVPLRLNEGGDEILPWQAPGNPRDAAGGGDPEEEHILLEGS